MNLKRLISFAVLFLISIVLIIYLSRWIGYGFQFIRAGIEAIKLKPLYADTPGDCRIQNTISAIKNENLYIVLGKAKTFNNLEFYHEWTVKDVEKADNFLFIVDKTTGITEDTKKLITYIPFKVYKLNKKNCQLSLVKEYKKPENLKDIRHINYAEKYIEYFCLFYKLRK